MTNHFAIMDIKGKDAERMLEYHSVAKVGEDTSEGRMIYTNFLEFLRVSNSPHL